MYEYITSNYLLCKRYVLKTKIVIIYFILCITNYNVTKDKHSCIYTFLIIIIPSIYLIMPLSMK